MNILVVTAHPLSNSLCMEMTGYVADILQRAGHTVTVEDLYRSGFDPTLTANERKTYYTDRYDGSAVRARTEKLLEAQAIVLLFPTWWFGFPAILKGWFDRVWGPGIAYDHASDFGPIKPRLHHLKRMLVVTTLGAPGWIDYFIMRRPIRKILKTALRSTCAPKCKFEMLSLYKAENLADDRVDRFKARIQKTLRKWS